MFDPETLRTFIAVAETGSFSKAAERLCKTTATISYRIKLLEENTGVALFFRTTRSVTLTAAGEHLLSQARDWLSWLESMPSELQQVNDGVERQVNIVINNLLYNPQAVAQLLAWLNERYLPLYPVSHLPTNLYGRLGLAIVRRFFAGYRRHGN